MQMPEIRRHIKKSTTLMAVACLFVMSLLALAPSWRSQSIRLSADRYENPADGMASFHVTATLSYSFHTLFGNPEVHFHIESGRDAVRVIHKEQKQRTTAITLLTTTRPGSIMVRASAGGFDRATITLQTLPWLEDRDGDGFPDVMKLTSFDDQESFRRWFALIAESQYYQESPAWDDRQKDCAGLVRFALREALRIHSAPWFQRVQPKIQIAAPDVSQYHYPHTPLGDKLFRTRADFFRDTDLSDDTFSSFADAKTIKHYNCVFVGKRSGSARKGDLLFYYQPGAQPMPYHLMIYLGDALVDGHDRSDWVVYHTGPTAGQPGTVRKVTLAMLNQHPSKRWRPVAENTQFLGFYRLKILE